MNSTGSSRGNHRITSLRHRQQSDWKESLRRACLDRARNNRKQVLWKRRRGAQPQPAMDDDAEGDIFKNNNGEHPPTTNTVRTVVEQELRQQGVSIKTRAAVVSPATSSRTASTACSSTSPDTTSGCYQDDVVFVPDQIVGTLDETAMMVEDNISANSTRHSNTSYERQNSYDSDSTEYVISEEELYELLQDVEEEMLRSGTFVSWIVCFV